MHSRLPIVCGFYTSRSLQVEQPTSPSGSFQISALELLRFKIFQDQEIPKGWFFLMISQHLWVRRYIGLYMYTIYIYNAILVYLHTTCGRLFQRRDHKMSEICWNRSEGFSISPNHDTFSSNLCPYWSSYEAAMDSPVAVVAAEVTDAWSMVIKQNRKNLPNSPCCSQLAQLVVAGTGGICCLKVSACGRVSRKVTFREKQRECHTSTSKSSGSFRPQYQCFSFDGYHISKFGNPWQLHPKPIQSHSWIGLNWTRPVPLHLHHRCQATARRTAWRCGKLRCFIVHRGPGRFVDSISKNYELRVWGSQLQCKGLCMNGIHLELNWYGILLGICG